MKTEMANRQDEILFHEFYDKQLSEYIPHFSVDCVTLGFHAGMLKVLLCKMNILQKWILPGGFVYHDECVDDAAIRILKKRTSLKDVYLKQFHLFGHKDRRPREEADEILDALQIEDRENHWLKSRYLSVGYYVLVKYGKIQIRPNVGEELDWFGLNELPELYLDHEEIIKKAIKSIRNDVGYIPIGYELLPSKFTMPELRTIYETILERELDRRNFQRKMLSTGLIIPLNETRREGAHKSPNLYSFNKERYIEAREQGMQLMHVIL